MHSVPMKHRTDSHAQEMMQKSVHSSYCQGHRQLEGVNISYIYIYIKREISFLSSVMCAPAMSYFIRWLHFILSLINSIHAMAVSCNVLSARPSFAFSIMPLFVFHDSLSVSCGNILSLLAICCRPFLLHHQSISVFFSDPVDQCLPLSQLPPDYLIKESCLVWSSPIFFFIPS